MKGMKELGGAAMALLCSSVKVFSKSITAVLSRL